jgi:hypothetical protein
MRQLFFNGHHEWRTGWRIVAMFVLLVATTLLINLGWRAVGMPGQRAGTAWHFLAFASLVSGAALAVIMLLLRYFENQGTSAIGLSIALRYVRAPGARRSHDLRSAP